MLLSNILNRCFLPPPYVTSLCHSLGAVTSQSTLYTPSFLNACQPSDHFILCLTTGGGGWGGCSTSQKYQLKGEVRPRECQSLPFINTFKTFLPERSITLFPTADRFYCDNCSSALAHWSLCGTKTYSDSALNP